MDNPSKKPKIESLKPIEELLDVLESKSEDYNSIYRQINARLSFINLMINEPSEGNQMLEIKPNIKSMSELSEKIDSFMEKCNGGKLEELLDDYIQIALSWEILKNKSDGKSNKMKIERFQ
jgi:hypothetical protein